MMQVRRAVQCYRDLESPELHCLFGQFKLSSVRFSSPTSSGLSMAKKGAKATKKFAKSGELKRQIDTRRKHQKVKKQIQARKSVRGAPVVRGEAREDENDEGNDLIMTGKKNKGKGRAKAVDFLDEDDDQSDAQAEPVASKGK